MKTQSARQKWRCPIRNVAEIISRNQSAGNSALARPVAHGDAAKVSVDRASVAEGAGQFPLDRHACQPVRAVDLQLGLDVLAERVDGAQEGVRYVIRFERQKILECPPGILYASNSFCGPEGMSKVSCTVFTG